MKKTVVFLFVISLMLFTSIGVVGCDAIQDAVENITEGITNLPDTNKSDENTRSATPSISTATTTPSSNEDPVKTTMPIELADIKMVSIPGGTDLRANTVSPFSMAQYEITYAQWIKVKEWGLSHGYSFDAKGVMGSGTYADTAGIMDETHPAVAISWYSAVKWCNALSEMEGLTPCYYTSADQSTIYRQGVLKIQNEWVNWNANGYRLPTETEWEYACRAGTKTDYSYGEGISGQDANYLHSGDLYDNATTPVGYYKPNPWGLYDMHGNASEWCWDWYSETCETGKNNPHGPSSGEYRVIRGGSWYVIAIYTKSTYRGGINPEDTSGPIKGFRIVRF